MAWYRCTEGSGGGGGGAEYLMDNLVPNTYIDAYGVEKPYNGWSSTPYIPVTAGETIKMALYNTDKYAAWYSGASTASATFLSRFEPTSNGYLEVTVPAGATFFRYSNENAYMARTMIWRDTQ